MLMLIVLPLFLAAGPPADTAEVPDAATYAAAGEAHLRRATSLAEHPIDEFHNAHTNFDAAYLVDESTVYLCRALAVADLTLRTAAFADEQERLFWQETRQDDLDRLAKDAAETGRANCRFDATGKPAAPRVAMLSEADIPPRASTETPAPTADADDRSAVKPSRAQLRRGQAHMGAGALLTGAGIGMLGVVAGVLALERERAVAMNGLINTANAEQRRFTAVEDRRFRALAEDLIQGRDMAIGVGVAGLVSLGTGVALLATRKRASRRGYALQPYGGLHGAGAVLRLKF